MRRDLPRRLLYRAWASRHPDEPWMSPAAVDFLDRAIDRSSRAVEWGSGRSTAWFAGRVAHLTSVEEDPGWLAAVERMTAALSNVELLHVPVEDRELDLAQRSLTPYVRVADRFGDGTLGLAVVDGAYRRPCLRAVLPKLEPWGLLVVDDSAWFTFDEWGVPKSWPVVHHSRFLTRCTTVWRKPGPSPVATAGEAVQAESTGRKTSPV